MINPHKLHPTICPPMAGDKMWAGMKVFVLKRTPSGHLHLVHKREGVVLRGSANMEEFIKQLRNFRDDRDATLLTLRPPQVRKNYAVAANDPNYSTPVSNSH